MTTVGIIGFGRFAQFWANQLVREYSVSVTDIDESKAEIAARAGITFVSLEELCSCCDCLFICVPINRFEAIVQEIQPLVRAGMTVIDVCSVKEFPARIMKDNLLTSGIHVIATHPLFGPDSGKDGVKGLRLVMWPVTERGDAYLQWRSFFVRLQLQVVEMSPTEHDQLAAYSQGVAHCVSRVLQRLELVATPIDTKGFEILLSIIEQTCNDSEELFRDLQNYNRFTPTMRRELNEAMRRVDCELMDTIITPNSPKLRIGIQGGPGSFNEFACLHLFSSYDRDAFEIIYLMRTSPVLEWLQDGRVDRAVFALYNRKAGIVRETLDAITTYPCEIITTTDIIVRHCLVTHSSASLGDVDTIVSHEQVLSQCAKSLAERVPHLKRLATDSEEFREIAGKSFSLDLIDQAVCAKYLSEGKLARNLALIVPQMCAEMFRLRIHVNDIQDEGEGNRTTFALATRRR